MEEKRKKKKKEGYELFMQKQGSIEYKYYITCITNYKTYQCLLKLAYNSRRSYDLDWDAEQPQGPSCSAWPRTCMLH